MSGQFERFRQLPLEIDCQTDRNLVASEARSEAN